MYISLWVLKIMILIDTRNTDLNTLTSKSFTRGLIMLTSFDTHERKEVCFWHASVTRLQNIPRERGDTSHTKKLQLSHLLLHQKTDEKTCMYRN